MEICSHGARMIAECSGEAPSKSTIQLIQREKVFMRWLLPPTVKHGVLGWIFEIRERNSLLQNQSMKERVGDNGMETRSRNIPGDE